jgi:hypothetical protein
VKKTAQGRDGSSWRAHSCAPHPDSSGCSANTRRFRGSPPGIATSGDTAPMSAQCRLLFPQPNIGIG